MSLTFTDAIQIIVYQCGHNASAPEDKSAEFFAEKKLIGNVSANNSS